MEYCSKCGAQIPEGSVFCPKCGQPVEYTERVYEPEVQQSVRVPPRTPAGSQPTESAGGALALGIIGIIVGILLIPCVGCILGIAAVAIASSANKRGVPNAGAALALGWIAIIVSLVIWAITFYILASWYYLF
jgi:cytochrome c biogenesis protein CcdA